MIDLITRLGNDSRLDMSTRVELLEARRTLVELVQTLDHDQKKIFMEKICGDFKELGK